MVASLKARTGAGLPAQRAPRGSAGVKGLPQAERLLARALDAENRVVACADTASPPYPLRLELRPGPQRSQSCSGKIALLRDSRNYSMSARLDRSPIKAPPLRDPGQSIRNAVIDLVLGRFLVTLWIASVACALLIQAWVSERLGWRLTSAMWALPAGGLSVLCILQFAYVRRRVQSLQLGRDGERAVAELLERDLI